jgi:hypothetical protein
MPQTGIQSVLVTDTYNRLGPMEVASVTGPYYEAVPDPLIKDLERGAGATRPLDSFSIHGGVSGDDSWWNDLGSVTRKIIITTGENECFRDDILDFATRLQKVASTQGGANGGDVLDKKPAVEIELVLDDSFHAVLVSDFAFGIPPGTLAARLSGWLVKALRN